MPERVLMNEIEKHQPRVGKKPEARLQWAIDFAASDLASLTGGDRENLRRDLAAFAYTPQVPDVKRYVRSSLVRGEVARLGRHDWQGAYGEMPMWEEVQQAQVTFRRTLEQFLTEGEVRLGPLKITYYIVRTDIRFKAETNERRSDFLERVHQEDAPWGLLPFARLLGAFGFKLETCPEPTCRRLYVVRRINQHFCSTRCQSRTTTRAYRERMAKPGRKGSRSATRR